MMIVLNHSEKFIPLHPIDAHAKPSSGIHHQLQ